MSCGHLEVEDLTEAQAEMVAERTGDLWPVGYGIVTRRRFRLFGPLLAGTIRVLGEELAQGFVFRATWVGSPVREDVELDAEELARIVQRSGLNEFTRYRVTPR